MSPPPERRWTWALACVAVAGLLLLAARLVARTNRWGWLLLPVGPGLLGAALALRELRARLRQGRPPFALVGFACFLALAGLAGRRASYRPEGDEPWYLLQAESLARDDDLVVTAAEVADRSRWSFGMPIDSSQLERFDGVERVPHWPAPALLLMPAARVHSRALGLLSCALLASLALAAGAALLARLAGSDAVGCALALSLLAFGPLGQYALLFFPDGQAAALWLLAAWLVTSPGVGRAVLSGLLLALATAMRPSLVLLAPGAALAGWTARGRPTRAESLAAMAGLGGGLGLFVLSQLATYGTLAVQPFRLDPAGLPAHTWAALMEPGRGLLLNYPLWALLIPIALWAARAWSARLLAATALLGMLPAVAYAQSAGVGGWCPAARFWTAPLCVLAAALACSWPNLRGLLERLGVRAAVGLACALSLATNLAGDLAPAWSFTDGPHWLSRAAAARFRP